MSAASPICKAASRFPIALAAQVVPPPTPRKTRQLPALSGLRFFLALWVIAHHLTGRGQMLEPAALALPSPLYTLIRGGYMAVATFFVLSGFVLAYSYPETRWTGRGLLRYGAGRLARVYPVYLLSLAVVAPFIAADRIPARAPLLAAHVLLLQGWLGSIPVNWNTPAWALSCEMFFYLIFPLAAILILGRGWRGALAVAAVSCALTRLMLFCGVPDAIKPLIHLSDFLMGMAAARLYALLPARATAPPRGSFLYLPAFALGAALIACPQWLPHGLDLNTALRPVNALLIAGLAFGGGIVARLLSTRAAVYLGQASYAMYILHVPILWWYLRWHGASAALYVGVVIAVSALVFRFVEEPANRWLRARVQAALQA